MVGDGINDAPALAEAHVGIAMGAAGTDAAIEATDVTLTRDDWRLVPEVIALGRRAFATIKQNLWFTAAYNIVGIGLAAVGAYFALGNLGLRQGQFDRAAAAFRSAVEISRTWDIPAWGDSEAGWACAQAFLGERDEAIRVLEGSSPTARRDGVRLFLALRAAWLGEAARRCSQPQEAWRLGGEGLRLACAQRQRGDEAWALYLLGSLAADREPPDLSASESHYADALTQGDALGMRPLIAQCHRGLGMLSRRTGALDRARRELRMALDLYHELGMVFWQEATKAELVQLQ